MSARPPGDLIAARLAVLPDGDVAEVVMTERTAAYGERLREAYVRWFGHGAWSAWQLLTAAVSDVSIAADMSQEEHAALVSAVIWVPLPTGVIAANHAANQLAYFRVTASGAVRVDL
jgi:hypothetical protein